MPETASATKREGGETACDQMETSLRYREREFASVIDRLSEEKVHTVTAVFDGGSTLTWDDTKLLRDGKVIFESTETSLQKVIEVFLAAASGGEAPPTAGDFGAKVLEIQEKLG